MYMHRTKSEFPAVKTLLCVVHLSIIMLAVKETTMFCLFYKGFTFICNLDKQTESLRRLQHQLIGNVMAEIFGSRTGLYLKGLQSIVIV